MGFWGSKSAVAFWATALAALLPVKNKWLPLADGMLQPSRGKNVLQREPDIHKFHAGEVPPAVQEAGG